MSVLRGFENGEFHTEIRSKRDDGTPSWHYSAIFFFFGFFGRGF